MTPQSSTPYYSVTSNCIISGGATASVGTYSGVPNRRVLFIQNVGSGGPLFVLYSTGTPTGTAPIMSGQFSYLLAPATTLPGAGGSVYDYSYKGPFTISGGANVYWMSWQA